MRFTEEFIEQVRAGNPIADVVGEYVHLQKKQGNKYWACCPFHNEKTPSFSVSPEKGFFYCFGCHAGGDVFKFVQQYENCSFLEAVEKLANRIHLALPEEDMSPEERKREAYRRRLYEVCELAADYFHNCLTKTRMGTVGIDYWKKRGLTAQTIVDFKLGYAPPEWDRMFRDFSARGYDAQVLVDAGLCMRKNGKVYDRFRGRCMFPIRDAKGRTVAFGGRILEQGEPKYLNSAETPIFNKGRLLYGLERAMPAIRQSGQAVLVEGYMDVVGVYNQGVKNVVASLGTAFTEDQARLLKRLAKEVIVAYDMDRAGREATKRVIEIAAKNGLRLRIATLPDGKDPDEYIKDHGVEAWLQVMRSAQDVVDYRLEEEISAQDITNADGKNAVLKEIFPLLADLDNAVAVDGYLGKIAKRLRMDEGIIRSEATRYFQKNKRDIYVAPARTKEGDSRSENENLKQRKAEEQVLGYILDDGPGANALFEALAVDDFETSLYRKWYSVLQAHWQEQEPLKLGESDFESEEEKAKLAEILIGSERPEGELRENYIRPLKVAALQRAYDEHCRRAEECDRQGDADGYRREMLAGMKVNEELRKW